METAMQSLWALPRGFREKEKGRGPGTTAPEKECISCFGVSATISVPRRIRGMDATNSERDEEKDMAMVAVDSGNTTFLNTGCPFRGLPRQVADFSEEAVCDSDGKSLNWPNTRCPA